MKLVFVLIFIDEVGSFPYGFAYVTKYGMNTGTDHKVAKASTRRSGWFMRCNKQGRLFVTVTTIIFRTLQ
jgi:hypothetical protein